MDKRELIRKRYADLSSKYTLPSLEDLDREIELLDYVCERLEVPDHLLNVTVRRFVDVVGGWINYLHNFLLPNQQSMILVHESENVTQEEKEEIINIINQLMFMSRVSAKLEIEKNEAASAEFLMNGFKRWLEIKETMLIITGKNVKIWQEAMQKKEREVEKGHYFG